MSVTTSELTRLAFWFLRHGETDWNVQGLSQGNTDIPLNPNGVAQACMPRRRRCATEVSPRSCPRRCRARVYDTAMIAAEVLDLPVEIDDDLREVAFGAKEGHPQTEWFADWVGGSWLPDGAETFTGLRLRAVAAVNRALTRPAPVLVVGHGALFRALRADMGMEPNVRTPNATPFFCEPGMPAWTLTPLRG